MGRRDAKLVKNIDSMHVIMPLIYPNRCDNEAFIAEAFDITEVNKYIEEKNRRLEAEAGEGEEIFKYTLFHFIVSAVLKTVKLRPKLNYFIANNRMYERNTVSAAFVVKKKFSDSSGEGLAVLDADDKDNIESIHEKIKKQVYITKKGTEVDGSTESMDLVTKLPFFLVRFVVWVCRWLDKHGKVPNALIATDPYYRTVVFSNLGSIKLKSGYHHLTNWGTNSIFAAIGEIKDNKVPIGLTIDERIADGYYYSKSIRLLKKLFECPWLLDDELSKEVDYK